MTHRCILRCLTQLGFEALSVATTQSIAWKTGPSFSLRGLPCEWSQNDLEEDSVYVLSFFFNTSPSSGKNLRARSREKKPVELNQTALLVGDIYSDLRVDLAMTGAINVRFFLWTFLQKGSERCVLIDFDLQNYPSPVLWRWFSMYPRVSKLVSTTRICAMVIVKTFLPEDVVENIAEAVAW